MSAVNAPCCGVRLPEWGVNRGHGVAGMRQILLYGVIRFDNRDGQLSSAI